jgi:hypothetical protein
MGYWPGPLPARGGPNCTRTGVLAPGESSGWLEVGSSMDVFIRATWRLPAAGFYNLTVGVAKDSVLASGGGQGAALPDRLVEPIAQFRGVNRTLELLFDPSTRQTRQMREYPDEFYRIVAALDEQTAALPPRRAKAGADNSTWPGIAVPTVYMSVGVGVRDFPADLRYPSKKYNDTLMRFFEMLPPPHVQSDCGGCGATLDPKKLEACNASMSKCVENPSKPGPYGKDGVGPWGTNPQGTPNTIIELGDMHALDLALSSNADPLACVPEGDEVNLNLVPHGNASVASKVFQGWAVDLQLSSADVGCPSTDWEHCYNISIISKTLQFALDMPSLSYHWTKFKHDYGIRAWAAVTKTILGRKPDAAVGANFSPGDDYSCPTFQFIRAFRPNKQGSWFPELNGHPAMTLPWGEDPTSRFGPPRELFRGPKDILCVQNPYGKLSWGPG